MYSETDTISLSPDGLAPLPYELWIGATDCCRIDNSEEAARTIRAASIRWTKFVLNFLQAPPRRGGVRRFCIGVDCFFFLRV